MQFGLYAPIPMATVGSPEAAQAVTEALAPLPEIDPHGSGMGMSRHVRERFLQHTKQRE